MGYCGQASNGKTLRRVIVDPAEKTRLILACHDGIDGGHFGRDKTLRKVLHVLCCQSDIYLYIIITYILHLQTYWWKGIANDVAEYCKRCDVCQHINSRLGKAKAELHPIPVTNVWKQIGIGMATVTKSKCDITENTLYIYIM